MMQHNQCSHEKNGADRWKLCKNFGILWDVEQDPWLPHQDSIEMSGQLVSLIATYGVGYNGELVLAMKVVWPTLRTIPNDTFASLIREYRLERMPEVYVNQKALMQEKPYNIKLDGMLTIQSRTEQQLDVKRTLFPSTEHGAVIECFKLENTSEEKMHIEIRIPEITSTARGTYGIYMLEVACNAPYVPFTLGPGESVDFGLAYSGRKLMEARVELNPEEEEEKRRKLVREMTASLRLETPDPVLNRAFDFAKIRAGESIFKTKGGLMHSPGGEAYYAAVWANDQAEYAGPFFPFLGYKNGIEASLNCYRLYRPFMGPDYQAIPSSIIAEGVDIWEGAGDRGDAAMYAYGASRFALALGDRGIGEELWPAIVWCLEYCNRKQTPEGVIASDTDELEGRFPSGHANLSTSCLTYGGLRSAANLARELGRTGEAELYDVRAEQLEHAIENYFGARVQGFDTYRYYEGNEVLRAWICLPLTLGILKRKEGTLAALFSQEMWTEDGLLTQAGDTTFWDRTTLYGLRSVFTSGETEKGLEFLKQYTRRRLLGEHVPYAIEAYPEGNKRHLSAESALYCRVITEGLFGITPTGLASFTCTPRLPAEWQSMALRSIQAFGQEFDFLVERVENKISILVTSAGRPIFRHIGDGGEAITIRLPADETERIPDGL